MKAPVKPQISPVRCIFMIHDYVLFALRHDEGSRGNVDRDPHREKGSAVHPILYRASVILQDDDKPHNKTINTANAANVY